LSKDVKNAKGEVVGREKRRTNIAIPTYPDPMPYTKSDKKGRLQLAPPGLVEVKAGPGKGKKLQCEQAVVAGWGCTGIYTKVVKAA